MKTKLLLSILLMLFTGMLYSNDNEKAKKILTTTAIPDPAFEQALIDLGHDNVIDGKVLTANISGLTNLDVSDPLNNGNLPNVTTKISDLTGIEDFIALEVLKVSDNDLSSINLSSNVNLKELWGNSNSLSSIDITSNVLLEVFYLIGNQVTTIDLNQNVVLKELYVTSNLLTAIDVSKNINLIRLNCAENQIKVLDVSKNLALTHLNTHLNLIESIDVSLNTNLRVLQCNNNNLKALNIVNGNNLNMGLWAYANSNLTCIQADANSGPPAGNVQIDSQTSFNTDCNYPTTIVPDSVFENYLETHDRDGNTVSLGDATSMGNGIANDQKVFTYRICNVTTLDVSGESIGVLTGLEDFRDLEVFGFLGGSTTITNMDLSNNTKLKKIHSGLLSNLSTITLGNLPNLTFLQFGYDNVSSIDISGLPNLDRFNAPQSKLTSLSTINNHKLRVLGITSPIKHLDVSSNTMLENLGVGPDLETLNIANGNNNNLALSIQNNPNLTCITVDSATPSNGLSGWTFDSQHTFSANCSPNTAPICVADTYSTTENTTLTVTATNGLLANDIDADGDTLTITDILVQGIPFAVGTSFGYGGTNSVVIYADGSYDFTPDTNFTGNFPTISYTISDGNGGTSTCTLDISVVANTAPVCNSDTNTTTENTPLNVTATNGLLANDTDADGDTLTITDILVQGIPFAVGTSFGYGGTNSVVIYGDGSYDFTPDTNFTGNFPTISYTISDGNGGTSSCTLDISVTTAQQITLIPDSNFEQFLINQSIDSDGVINGQILTSDTNGISSLGSMRNRGISDLTGIEAFKDLNIIDCRDNALTHIDLSSNTKLKFFYGDNNQFVNLDFSSNSLINNVTVQSNNLKSLNFNNGLNSITFFDARYNSNLECIEVFNVAYMSSLSVGMDSQMSYSTDCSTVWTVMTNSATTTALLAITPSIDTSGDGEITLAEAAAYTGTLDLSGTGITDVEGLQAFTGITTLNVSGNGITDLSPLTNSSFTTISRASGKTRTVAKTTPMALETLVISNNNFDVIDVSSLTNLKVIKLNDNPDLITVNLKNGNNAAITEFNAVNTPKLTCILVDDINANYLSNWTKDDASTYVADETDCRSRVLSVTQENLHEYISVYPNPIKDFLTVKLSNQLELKKVTVLSLLGKEVIKSNEEKVNLRNLPSGVYLLKVTTDKGVVTKKIIKE